MCSWLDLSMVGEHEVGDPVSLDVEVMLERTLMASTCRAQPFNG